MIYPWKSFGVWLVLLINFNLSYGQISTDSLAKQVHLLQGQRLKNIMSEERDSVFNLFDSTMNLLMNRDDFHLNPVDTNLYYFYNCNRIPNDTNVTLAYTFMNRNTYCNSPDGRLRVYSWEDLGGGCGHMYRNQLVYKNGQSEIVHFQLDTIGSQSEYDGWAYFGFYNIEQHSFGKKEYYFLHGFGTSCGSSAYKTLRILVFEDGRLIECTTCYPNEKDFILRANRPHYIPIQLDGKKQTLTYRKYKFDEDIGFYKRDSFEAVTLKFKKGKFQEQKRR